MVATTRTTAIRLQAGVLALAIARTLRLRRERLHERDSDRHGDRDPHEYGDGHRPDRGIAIIPLPDLTLHAVP